MEGLEIKMADQFNNIYQGKRVLITGHTGFKGSWLSLWLTELGAEVVGYSLDAPTTPSHFKLLNTKITSVIGDVLNKEKLLRTVTKYKPDIVFHLAAQPIVRESYVNPVKTLETNIMGTVNLLESCRKSGQVKAIVVITSDKCYQNKELKRGYKEDDPMGGHDPYSASKGCAELAANSYRNSFFNVKDYGITHHILLADARAGNVIGGGDWAKDRLIPDIMKGAGEGKTAIIRNPQSVRPWQHVLEPLSGYLTLGWKLLEGKKEFADNWNFGPTIESSLTVGEVLKNAQKYWDKIRFEIQSNPNAVHENILLLIDSSKARKKLKWKSLWSGNKTFEKTVLWYKEYYTTGKVMSLENLNEYINDAKRISVEWANS